jgi:AcrR family transcriptional regulator
MQRKKKRFMDTTSLNQNTLPRRERRDATENRERLLLVARQLFAEKGVSETSMNEIAHAAQVGPGTLYRHFAHKGELCEALLKNDMAAFWTRVDTMLEQMKEESPLSQLDWLIDATITLIDMHIPLLAIVMEGRKPSSVEMEETPFQYRIQKVIAELLTKAIAQGEIRELNVTFTADIIETSFAPSLYVFQQKRRGLSREQISAEMRRLFVDGLRRP